MLKLFDHQRKLIELNPKRWLLAWGTGSGKSLTAIRLIENNCKNAIVICPKSLVEQWLESIEKYGEKEVKWEVTSKEQFKKRYKGTKCSFNGCVIDEAHYFFGYKSGMFKTLKTFLDSREGTNIYLLTATPYMSSSFNIWCAGVLLGKIWKWWDWKKKFFSEFKIGNRRIPVEKKKIGDIPTEEYLAKIVNSLGNTVKLEDCTDIPEQIFETEYFDLTKNQEKAIKELIDIIPIVRFTKISQICGGTLKSDGYIEDSFYESEKINRLLEYVNENKKIVIVCRYNNEIDYIKSKIKNRKIFIINGSVINKNEIVKECNSLDDCIIIVNAACSEGYSLETFPIMIFYSLDFSLKNLIQMWGRIQRINNIKKNIYIYFICKNTVDEDVYKCVVINKVDVHNEIINKYGK